MRKYTKEELIEKLKQLRKEVGKTPTIIDLLKTEGYPSYQAYYYNFGSWNNALTAAKLAVNYSYKHYSDEELLNIFKQFQEKHKRAPKIEDFGGGEYPGHSTYCKRFGSWNNALEKAGLEINVKKDYTKEELLELLKKKAKELGRNPTSNDLGKENHMPDLTVFQDRFETWNNALTEAGLEINAYYRKWSKDDVIKWLLYKYDELGKTPGIRDFDKDPKAPAKNTVRKLFGNWTNALREANIPVKRFRSKNELVRVLQKLAKELGRTPTREEIKSMKQYIRSYTPFVEKFGSYTAACLSAGLTPNDGRNNNIWKGWQKHCEDMARVVYRNIEIQKEGTVEGIPDIYIPSEKLFIDAKTCGYRDFKEQIKRYCKNNHRLEFWLIFKGIETKRKKVKYIYAEELAKKMVRLGRKDLAVKCHQFIKNVYCEEQRMLSD